MSILDTLNAIKNNSLETGTFDKESRCTRTTNDYNKFNFSKRNRNVILTSSHINNFDKNGIIFPIVVNENMTIIDGQHRFRYAQQRGIPFDYLVIEGLDDDSIVDLNTTQKSWSITDYVEAYANDGNPEYERLIALMNSYDINTSALTAISMGRIESGGMLKVIKDKSFKFLSYEKTVEFLEDLTFVKSAIPSVAFKQRQSLSLFSLWRFRKFKTKRLVKKIKQMNDESVERFNANTTSAPVHTVTKLLLDIYNKDLTMNSEEYMEYHIDSRGYLKIDEEFKDAYKKECIPARKGTQ